MRGWPPRSRRTSSILSGVRGRAAKDSALSFGQVISIRASNRCEFNSPQALTWGSLEFPGGPQISVDSTVA